MTLGGQLITAGAWEFGIVIWCACFWIFLRTGTMMDIIESQMDWIDLVHSSAKKHGKVIVEWREDKHEFALMVYSDENSSNQ